MSLLLQHIQSLMAIQIHQVDLIASAFHHTSYVNEQNRARPEGKLRSNERLEYLGDAVLELIVSDYLFHYYPHEDEGFLSRTRATLVQEESLGRLAKELKLDQFILLGKGERANGGQYRYSILSDCFEALLGAIYIDQGLDVVRTFLEAHLLKDHQDRLAMVNRDYKTLLQERVQQGGDVKIDYRLVKEEGPDHHRQFEMGLYINDRFIAKGKGRSKKQAEAAAAKLALESNALSLD